MNTSIYMTLGEAAKATGISKPTISKYIKKGRMSAGTNDNGSYKIDPAELFRVFPPNNGLIASKHLQSLTPDKQDVTTSTYTELRTEIEILKVRLEAEVKRAINLESERDDWKDQAKRLLLQAPQKPAEARGGFFATLLRKKS